MDIGGFLEPAVQDVVARWSCRTDKVGGGCVLSESPSRSQKLDTGKDHIPEGGTREKPSCVTLRSRKAPVPRTNPRNDRSSGLHRRIARGCHASAPSPSRQRSYCSIWEPRYSRPCFFHWQSALTVSPCHAWRRACAQDCARRAWKSDFAE